MIPKNIERRIRQHVYAKKHTFFAVIQPGFENTALYEIYRNNIEMSNISVIQGGIEFTAGIREMWALNYLSRCVTRILMRLATFKVLYFDKFRSKTASIPWELYLAPECVPAFSIKCRHSRLYHTGRLEDECRNGITERMKTVYSNGTHNKNTSCQTVYIRLEDDICTLSIDTTGDPLYKRGLRTHISKAPIRETLASCILYEADILNFTNILDPMCGSGIFPMEAAFILNNTPAGITRKFAFEYWPGHKDKAFTFLKNSILKQDSSPSVNFKIFANDIDKETAELTCRNLNASGLVNKIEVTSKDFFSLKREQFPDENLLIVTNPPYGGRIDIQDLTLFYKNIGNKLNKDFSGSHFAVIVPGSAAEKAFGISPDKKIPFVNGGKKVILLIGKC
ncbi:MAG: hypothetical protein JW864_16400 [Spirochaetes bacterium]|nr:hypothetical protein [Spirochaetota bacterium]